LISLPVVWSSSKVTVVDATALAFSPVGGREGIDPTSAISSVYGSSYQYALYEQLSNLNIAGCKTLPTSFSVESNLTYVLQGAMSPPSALAAALADGGIITVGVRRSVIVLGDNSCDASTESFTPRWYHPKSGFNMVLYNDDSAPALGRRDARQIVRHWVDTERGILFYIDKDAPEPFRTALVEGIQWWDEAFVYAGLPEGTVQARVAPEGILTHALG
jgi:hypothetical protein